MENQWQQLRAVLNGEHSERDGLSGQFLTACFTVWMMYRRENATACTHFMMRCNAHAHLG